MPTNFRVLSLIPPMTQLNTPYPSTAYLTGFLRSRGIDAVQEDLALALKLFTPAGLEALRGCALALPEGPRFAALDNDGDDGSGDPLGWAFGALGVQDKARHLG